jgi:hypothetical protein
MWSSLLSSFTKNCRRRGLSCLRLLSTPPIVLYRKSGIDRNFFDGGNSIGRVLISTLAAGSPKATTATTTHTGFAKPSGTATPFGRLKFSHPSLLVSRLSGCAIRLWGSLPGVCTHATLCGFGTVGLWSSLRTKAIPLLVLTATALFALSFSGCTTLPMLPPPMEDL